MIYSRYIVYQETLTQYFAKKNRREEKSLKIGKKSPYIANLSAFGDKPPIWWKKRPRRKKIIEISAINHRFFGEIFVLLSSVIWRPKSRLCWSDILDATRHVCLQRSSIQRPRLNLGVIQRLGWDSNGQISPRFWSNGQNCFSMVKSSSNDYFGPNFSYK